MKPSWLPLAELSSSPQKKKKTPPMDSPGIRAAPATRDSKRRAKKKNRVWRKRLHRRKTVVQPPTMQSVDKRGPKKIPEEWEQSAVWPSSKKPPQEAQPSPDSRRALRFACSLCKDSLEYVPKDLVRHFEENHRGSAPVFPCHMCTFKAQDFSYLQVHLLSHKDTFSSCNICNDNVNRSWSELSAHLTTHHCQNGKYSCEMCRKYSTGDVRLFLEHMCGHLMGLEGAEDIDLSLHTRDNNQFGSAAQSSRCQYCGFEASQKWLLTKHISANHVQKKKTELHSISKTPNETVPKMKPRLTRSAVREMCWLTQDCLSLPEREFLDKYCHLSDPQTTLEETQQFLMKSVAGETGDQKWTKALKSVLSNVPQDMNLHPRSENGIVTSSADLTVLTVKNKITVAQNGATYAKRLKMMASTEKETPPPESAAADAHCDQNGCQSNLSSVIQAEGKLNNDASASTHGGPPECALMQENRENQELNPNMDKEENVKPDNAHPSEDRIDVSSQLAVSDQGPEQTPDCKAPPKSNRSTRRRRRNHRSKTRPRRPAASGLKIVLKKNPEKEKQWVTQSSLSLSDGGDTTTEAPQKAPTLETHETTWTKASQRVQRDASEAFTSTAQPQSGGDGTRLHGSEKTAGNAPDGSASQEKRAGVEKSLLASAMEVDGNSAESLQLVSANGVPDPCLPVGDGATPPSSSTEPAPLPQPAITPLGARNSGDLHVAPSAERSDERISDKEVPADSLSSTKLPAGEAIRQESSPAAAAAAATGRRWQPIPKTQERTLKLIAIKPSQLIKCPTREQPVVVLNHPDADIPEVTRIMEVINRYSGEVHKVVLSRRTLKALSAGPAQTQDPAEPSPGDSLVRERFNLKLKLRRLSRKKYEVVGGASLHRDEPKRFRCWFCGRGFNSQETWRVHRQRHLMDWKRPNCENS